MLSLIKQQCNADWIKFGDEFNRYFFAKAKQRKLATYIYALLDQNDELIEGFEAVANEMLQFYTRLLGRQHVTRDPIDPDIIALGNTLFVEQQLALTAPFSSHDIKDAIFSTPKIKSP